MTDNTPAQSRRLALLKSARQMTGPRRSRLLGGGCFVLVIGGTALVTLIVVILIRAPSYIYDAADIREFVIGSRLSAALIVLFVAQALTTFLLGLMSAGSAASATHPEANPKPRIRIVSRRLVLQGIAALLLKFGMLATIVLGILFVESSLFGPPVDIDFGMPDSPIHFIWFAAVAVFLPHWLAEPFLRIRYSAALGALAGTWASARREKFAAGLSTRLAFGLLGGLVMIWGIALMTMVHRLTTDTIYSRGYIDYSGTPPFAELVLWLVPLYALGQIVLPLVYLRYSRVARSPESQKAVSGSFTSWLKKNTAAPESGGSE